MGTELAGAAEDFFAMCGVIAVTLLLAREGMLRWRGWLIAREKRRRDNEWRRLALSQLRARDYPLVREPQMRWKTKQR